MPADRERYQVNTHLDSDAAIETRRVRWEIPWPADSAVRLTDAQRDLLWTVAQHKYGWAHCPNVGGRVRRLQTARALERQGLVRIGGYEHQPTCAATAAGRVEIERRWPVSPFALGTYDHQPGGWTPVEGVR